MKPNHFIDMQSSDFECFSKYVLVDPVEPEKEEKTESGLVVSLTKTLIDSRPCTGTVVVSGDDKIKKGDFVVFPTTDGLDCQFNDGVFMLLKVESLIGRKKRD